MYNMYKHKHASNLVVVGKLETDKKYLYYLAFQRFRI